MRKRRVPTPHTPPPTSRRGDALHLSMAKHLVAYGYVPYMMSVRDENGVVHRLMIDAQLACGAEGPASAKIERSYPTCIVCAATFTKGM